MKKTIVKIVTAIWILSMLVGCAPVRKQSTGQSSDWNSTLDRIRSLVDCSKKGMFEKYGLQAELVDFCEDKEVNAAFASGEMEAANLATHTAIKFESVGVDLNLVLLEDVSTSADAILAGDGINRLPTSRVNRLPTKKAPPAIYCSNYALSQNGMTLADIVPVPMPASDAGSALISGSVPAAVTYEPYLTEAVKQNAALKWLYKAEERPGLISDVLVINSKWASPEPGSCQILTQGMG